MREEHASRGLGLPVLASHTTVHQTLLPYSTLLGWLRQAEPQPFNDVMEVGRRISCDYHVMSCDPHRCMYAVFVECMRQKFVGLSVK